MNPRRMTPNQMRYLCSRSIDAWNARNESSSRATVNLSNITHETLVYIASALNKAERIGSSVKTTLEPTPIVDTSSESENL